MGRRVPSRGGCSSVFREQGTVGMASNGMELARVLTVLGGLLSSREAVFHPEWPPVTSGCDLIEPVPYVQTGPGVWPLCSTLPPLPPVPFQPAPFPSHSHSLSCTCARRAKVSSLGQKHCRTLSRAQLTPMWRSATCSPDCRDLLGWLQQLCFSLQMILGTTTKSLLPQLTRVSSTTPLRTSH